jgi:hypothetical protein
MKLVITVEARYGGTVPYCSTVHYMAKQKCHFATMTITSLRNIVAKFVDVKMNILFIIDRSIVNVGSA